MKRTLNLPRLLLRLLQRPNRISIRKRCFTTKRFRISQAINEKASLKEKLVLRMASQSYSKISDEHLLRTYFLSWKTFTRNRILKVRVNYSFTQKRLRREIEERNKASRAQERKGQIRDNALSLITTLGIVFLFGTILYYNFLMIQPYITPL